MTTSILGRFTILGAFRFGRFATGNCIPTLIPAYWWRRWVPIIALLVILGRLVRFRTAAAAAGSPTWWRTPVVNRWRRRNREPQCVHLYDEIVFPTRRIIRVSCRHPACWRWATLLVSRGAGCRTPLVLPAGWWWWATTTVRILLGGLVGFGFGP